MLASGPVNSAPSLWPRTAHAGRPQPGISRVEGSSLDDGVTVWSSGQVQVEALAGAPTPTGAACLRNAQDYAHNVPLEAAETQGTRP